MSHRIVESTEAEWTPAEKVWASVQQFDPRRGNLRGHTIAALVGFGAAFLLIVIGF